MPQSASQRKFKKRVADLRELLEADPKRFTSKWSGLSRAWVGEVSLRAKSWRDGNRSDYSKDIYGVYDQARLLAEAIGAEKHRLVTKTLRDLQHSCATAVAPSTDYRLYRFSEDCTSRVSRSAKGGIR